MFVVYKHICPNGKIYIGITSQKPEKRWLNGKGYTNNDYFTKAIQKYGWERIKHEILFENLTKEEAEQKEIELIAKYKSNQRGHGYNISVGGSCATLGLHWKYNDKQRERRRGKNHPLYGSHLTDEQRKHLSEINSGKNHPQYGTHRNEKTKKKISEHQKGKVITVNQRKKISESLKGNIPVNCKKIICVETGEIFNSVAMAQKTKNISCIYRAIDDDTKTAGGYHWKCYKGVI